MRRSTPIAAAIGAHRARRTVPADHRARPIGSCPNVLTVAPFLPAGGAASRPTSPARRPRGGRYAAASAAVWKPDGSRPERSTIRCRMTSPLTLPRRIRCWSSACPAGTSPRPLRRVEQNGGAAGLDGMSTTESRPCLHDHCRRSGSQPTRSSSGNHASSSQAPGSRSRTLQRGMTHMVLGRTGGVDVSRQSARD